MRTPLHQIFGQPYSRPDSHEPAVWIADWNDPSCPETTDSDILSPSEWARTAKILDPRKREEFVNTRCFLREILGRRLGLPPDQVRLQASSRGKLACEQLRDHAFSVSHSHGVSVIAIAHCAAVGVDVERVIERATMAQLALRFFSKHEYRSWAAVGDAERTAAFYDLWTRKEAYLKALGTGLFDGSAKANSIVPLSTASLEDGAADRTMLDWHWRELELPNGYRGAVCWIASS